MDGWIDGWMDVWKAVVVLFGCCFVGKENSFLTKKAFKCQGKAILFSHFEFLGFPDHQ
jgi:hypothetical protein